MSVSISAIGPNYFSYTSQALDGEYEYVKKMLTQAGVIITGDKEVDKKALMMVQMSNSSVGKTQETSGQKEYLPWGDLMRELGLDPTGDREQDYYLISERLTEYIAYYADDESTRTYYEELLDGLNGLFAQYSASSTNQGFTMDFMGASDMLGQLNKLMFVNAR